MRVKIYMAALMTALSILLLSEGSSERLSDKVLSNAEELRMKNVVFAAADLPLRIESMTALQPEQVQPENMKEETVSAANIPSPELAELYTVIDSSADSVLKTTISGGISIKNQTQYSVDTDAILQAGAPLRLKSGTPQILIIHTHSSEAYTQAGLDRYEESDDHRTEDKEFSIIRIGDELAEIFEAEGLNVIHDREIYDYPSYTGSYTRSGEAIEAYLAEYPDIAVVLDIHRDALGSNGVVYKTMAEEDGTCASQLMLLVGTDESGLEHPHWRRNLALGLYLQNAVSQQYRTLMRPVELVRERYNQHLTTGSLILEVGSSGNTLQEALAGIRLFGTAAAPALKELVTEG